MVVPKTPTTTAAAAEFGVNLGQTVRSATSTPGDVNREQHRRVGQQRECQPLQEGDVTVIGDEHLQQQRSDHEEHRHQMTIEAGDELRDFPHGRDVGRDIEGIGDQQQQHDALEHDRGERGLDIGGKPFPGDPADARAHGLDRRHQREGQRHRPQHVEAELRARLGVGGYAAWIVVGDAGDEARSDARQGVLFQASPKEAQRGLTLRFMDSISRAAHTLYFTQYLRARCAAFRGSQSQPRCADYRADALSGDSSRPLSPRFAAWAVGAS